MCSQLPGTEDITFMLVPKSRSKSHCRSGKSAMRYSERTQQIYHLNLVQEWGKADLFRLRLVVWLCAATYGLPENNSKSFCIVPKILGEMEKSRGACAQTV